MENVLRDQKELRGSWFYSSDKMFLPVALDCSWDMSQPHVEVATVFVRSNLKNRQRVFMVIAGVSAAHLETPK